MMNNKLIHKVKKYIDKNQLLADGHSVLACVSGGADSVCLLDVLFQLQSEYHLKIYVAHVNHMLRDEESDCDEQFVKTLCKTYNVPFFAKHADVAKLAKENKITCEEAGRKVRYDFFTSLKQELSIDKIATAHNKNDNVETVCMRFVRGTGVNGLGGIPAENDLNVIRPLLSVSRQEIESYLNENQLAHITDSSNMTDDYTRNHIRHHFLPKIIEHYNKNFYDTLSENILRYSEAGNYLNKQIDKAYYNLSERNKYGISFSLKDLQNEDVYIVKGCIQKAIYECIKKDVVSKMVRTIYEKIVFGNTDCFTVDTSLSLYKKYNRIYFVKKEDLSFFYKRTNEKMITISETGDTLYFTENKDVPFPKNKDVIYIKKSMCDGKTFTIRNRKEGDRIQLPFGHKSIKKLLIDKKIPLFMRDTVPLILLDDEIIWVCGICDNPFFRATTHEPYIKISYTKENTYA